MKVLGMGNALVDIMTVLPNDDILNKHKILKGSMQLVDDKFMQQIVKESENYETKLASGGSAANTINGIARLGLETGFFGKVGKDSHGDFFISDLKENKIEPKILKSDSHTGLAIALVSADSERTFTVSLGAAVELSPSDITNELFKGYSILHIEGYLVQNHELIEFAVKKAKENGLKVSLDLASFNVVDDNLEFLQEISKKYVDIIFANEEEAKSFTGLNPEEAVNKIAEICDIAIVKIGKNGSYIKTNNKTYKVGVISANSIDTTGAGDFYASGFLYGLSKGYDMDKCGKIGAILSGNVIEVIGAKMDNKRWNKIITDVNNL